MFNKFYEMENTVSQQYQYINLAIDLVHNMDLLMRVEPVKLSYYKFLLGRILHNLCAINKKEGVTEDEMEEVWLTWQKEVKKYSTNNELSSLLNSVAVQTSGRLLGYITDNVDVMHIVLSMVALGCELYNFTLEDIIEEYQKIEKNPKI